MEIGSATSPFAAGFAVSQTMGTTGKQQADAAGSATDSGRGYQRALGSTASSASNVLANNFVQTNFEQSKYVTATVSNLQTERDFGDKMGTLLDSLKGQAALLNTKMHVSSHDSTYVVATLMQHKVKDGVKQVTNDEYMDQSADNLDDLKDEIEQRAEEATQPQDPSQGDAADTSQTADTADASTATTATDQAAPTGQDASALADTRENGGQQAETVTEAATAAGASNATGAATPPTAVSGDAATSEPAQNPSLLPPTTASLDILV
ncbi:conserved hypothetical protein [Solidesulfovibrio fructosivorans JJ]]|uniref:Uncharacterized protein n=1 Tax=Solidesulfovibrio fructosivorans JJ] TaxID=596151 RepID=E1JTJ9_SOLFR|nr:hypothetical protein [Solidesulfovibrio fructosivorans]EFL52459.1 conserved hypothetical protein [Solidesulfovibrio fructosivorans JJ]]